METEEVLQGKDKNVSWTEAGRELSRMGARYCYTPGCFPILLAKTEVSPGMH